MSLPVKLTIWTFGVVGIVAILTLAGLFAQTQRTYHRNFLEQSRQTLEILASAIGPDLAAGRHHRVQSAIDVVANFPERYPDLLDMRVLGPDGRVVAALDPREYGHKMDVQRQDPAVSSRTAKRVLVRSLAPDVVEIILPIRVAHEVGVIQAQISEQRLRESLQAAFLRVAFWVGVAALLLALLLYLILKLQITDRIVSLASVATSFRGGKMEVRAKVAGRDEIALLSDSFNQMAEAIQQYTENLQQLVRHRTEALQQANQQLSQLVITDPLTGLFNRRHFEERANRDLEIAKRAGKPFALVMCDLDHFKRINDQFGHVTGDKVLRNTAKVLQEQARYADLVARLGGEEFAIAMPNTSLPYAMAAAERLRQALAATNHGASLDVAVPAVTASFGIACFPEHGGSLEQLMERADEALYAAKNAGRNSVLPAAIDEEAQTLTAYRKHRA